MKTVIFACASLALFVIAFYGYVLIEGEFARQDRGRASKSHEMVVWLACQTECRKPQNLNSSECKQLECSTRKAPAP